MYEVFQIDEYCPTFSQVRFLQDCLLKNRIIACPVASGYSLICHPQNKQGLKKLQKCFSKEKKLAVVIYGSVSDIAKKIMIDQPIFKIIKKNSPSSCTFIVKTPPAFVQKIINDRRPQVGIRFPEEEILKQLISANNNEPLVAIGAIESENDEFAVFANELHHHLSIDNVLVVDYDRPIIIAPSTVVDCESWPVSILRQGEYQLIK